MSYTEEMFLSVLLADLIVRNILYSVYLTHAEVGNSVGKAIMKKILHHNGLT